MEKFTSVWDVVDKQDREETERVSGSRAIAIATHRVDTQLGKYLRTARTQTEQASRVSFVQDDLDRIVIAAATEHDSPIETVEQAVREFVASYKLACASCGCEGGKCGEGQDCGCKDCGSCGKESKTAGGHASDCTCGFCANKGSFGKSDEDEEEPEDVKEASVERTLTCPECGSKDVGDQTEHNGGHSVKCNTCGNRAFFDGSSEKVEASVHQADKALPGFNTPGGQNGDGGAIFGEHGGEYHTDDVSMLNSRDGVDDHGAVKTDHKHVPDDGLKPVAIKSEDHPHEDQNVEDRWLREYTGPYTDSGPADTTKRPVEHDVDAGAPIGDTKAIPTKTWGGDVIDPVTRAAKQSKWHLT